MDWEEYFSCYHLWLFLNWWSVEVLKVIFRVLIILGTIVFCCFAVQRCCLHWALGSYAAHLLVGASDSDAANVDFFFLLTLYWSLQSVHYLILISALCVLCKSDSFTILYITHTSPLHYINYTHLSPACSALFASDLWTLYLNSPDPCTLCLVPWHLLFVPYALLTSIVCELLTPDQHCTLCIAYFWHQAPCILYTPDLCTVSVTCSWLMHSLCYFFDLWISELLLSSSLCVLPTPDPCILFCSLDLSLALCSLLLVYYHAFTLYHLLLTLEICVVLTLVLFALCTSDPSILCNMHTCQLHYVRYTLLTSTFCALSTPDHCT